ncbi:MAG TPA: hypothetical protein VHW05_04915 [Phenylobacterium sp.]|nr:hypothetical protein [Phenylobacterium sp.]
MSELVQCEVHGAREATVVCCHVVETLRDGLVRGFRWFVDADGEYEATCDTCSSMSDDEWESVAVELGRVLCFACYTRAAELNGITSLERH